MSLMRMFAAAAVATTLSVVSTASAGTITGTTLAIPGATIPGVGSVAGGAYVTGQGHDAEIGQILSGPPDTGGLPNPNVELVGGFLFSIDSAPTPAELVAYQTGEYYWSLDFTIPYDPPPGSTGSLSTTVQGTYADITGNWNYDPVAGMYTWVDLYFVGGGPQPTISGPYGYIRFALDDSGYQGGQSSTYILPGGDVTINAVPVPLPAAAWAGSALLGGLGLAKRFRRKAVNI